MSTKESLLRYFHITNKLRKSPATFNEIDSYLKQQSELQSMNFNVSKRQFKRDLEDIGSMFSTLRSTMILSAWLTLLMRSFPLFVSVGIADHQIR